MFDGIKKEFGHFKKDPEAYIQDMSHAKSVGVAGAALVAFLGVYEGVHLGIAALTEKHEQITVSKVDPETPKAANLWGYKIGHGEVVRTTTGELLEDRPAWGFGKWSHIGLKEGRTYDVTTYKMPFMEPNVRSATLVENANTDVTLLRSMAKAIEEELAGTGSSKMKGKGAVSKALVQQFEAVYTESLQRNSENPGVLEELEAIHDQVKTDQQ